MEELIKKLQNLEKLDLRKYETAQLKGEELDELKWIKENICPFYCEIKWIIELLKNIPGAGKYIEVFIKLMDELCKCK